MRGINIDANKLKAASPLILPLVALYLLKFTSGPAPTLAKQIFDDVSQATPIRLIMPSEQSRLSADWAREQRLAPCGPSPFYYPRVADLDEHAEHVVDGPSPVPLPNARLDGVMGNEKRLVAMIDGGFLSLGDSVGNGWAIESIDVRARTVTLIHESGSRFLLESR